MLHIRKRDCRIVRFEKEKIVTAISKSFVEVGEHRGLLAKKIADDITDYLDKKSRNKNIKNKINIKSQKIPSVEQVQDLVEQYLIKYDLAKVAKAYILYRKKREDEREKKKALGAIDDLKLGFNSLSVLQARYLLKDDKGHIIETPSEMFKRVAHAIAEPDRLWRKDVLKTEEIFYKVMANCEFLPNSPTLMNAGTRLGQLAACFVLPIEDSLEQIYDSLKNAAIIHQSGGGTGFSFSKLRPKGDVVRSTHGVSSGPISFMKIFDASTDIIKQGGKRRGANMGIVRVDHPDILEFITCKSKSDSLRNFNISVGITDSFMRAVERDKEYPLINPRNNQIVARISAKTVFNLIVAHAWETGDPGVVFLDEINRKHPLNDLGEIEATNPCGEIPLFPYESCNLGSINLSKLVVGKKVNWQRLKELIHIGVHFLDNVIEANHYPLREIEEITKHGNRKIGLGVMGFADMLVKLGISYNSNQALFFARKLISFIHNEAVYASIALARERGSFGNFKKSNLSKKYLCMRNATLLSIAPTGSLSIIANCSPSIEPLFGIAFERHILNGVKLVEVNGDFEEIAKKQGFYSRQLMLDIAKTGSIQNLNLPHNLKNIFVSAMDITPQWHVLMQSSFQRSVYNPLSKTVNLPNHASLSDVADVYMLAYRMKCKGITVYRYGSKQEQVLYTGTAVEKATGESKKYLSEVSSCPSCR